MLNKTVQMQATILLCIAFLSLGVHASERSIYVMTNDYQKNEIVRYQAGNDGALIAEESRYETGGLGSGPGVVPDGAADPLGSQGSVTIDKKHRLLFAVNAGSDQVSVFRIVDNGDLKQIQNIESGGRFPVSQYVFGNFVYVLNAGNDGSIAAFRIGKNGNLSPIPSWTRNLHLGNRNPPLIAQGPAQIELSPNGKFLVVTVREVAKPGFYEGGSGHILVFRMNGDGSPAQTVVDNSADGRGPYAFNFDRHGFLIVSEVRGGGQPPESIDPNSDSAISSYRILPQGKTELIDRISTNQGGACWVEITGKFAYTTNTDTNNLTGLEIHADGKLSLLNNNPVIATAQGLPTLPGRAPLPLDFDITDDGRFMYILQPGTGSISAWKINHATGDLTMINQAYGLDLTPEVPIYQAFQPGGATSGLAIFEPSHSNGESEYPRRY